MDTAQGMQGKRRACPKTLPASTQVRETAALELACGRKLLLARSVPRKQAWRRGPGSPSVLAPREAAQAYGAPSPRRTVPSMGLCEARSGNGVSSSCSSRRVLAVRSMLAVVGNPPGRSPCGWAVTGAPGSRHPSASRSRLQSAGG